MLAKLVVILLLLIILYCLGSGVYYLIRSGAEPNKLAKALTWRIVLSLCLFGFLMLAYLVGWLTPHMIYVLPPMNH